MARVDRIDLPTRSAELSDTQFNKMARKLERERFNAVPEHKHDRYTRVSDREAYERNYTAIFGEKNPAKLQSGRTTYRYTDKHREDAQAALKRFKENRAAMNISQKPAIGFRKNYG